MPEIVGQLGQSIVAGDGLVDGGTDGLYIQRLIEQQRSKLAVDRLPDLNNLCQFIGNLNLQRRRFKKTTTGNLPRFALQHLLRIQKAETRL